MTLNKNIVLIGMPGSGKTTIAKKLSEMLDVTSIDVDELIEKSQNKSITEIFKKGEDEFRTIETDTIKKLSTENGIIISTGGGVIKNKSNINLLKKNGIILFINRPIPNILEDIDAESRPLLKEGTSKLYNLFHERYPLYSKYCDYEILNNGDIIDLSDKIIKIIREI
ncbi:MAG: shikimate kinase [Clostridium sp.]|nr:shikimate kinase [Clostridium sp.]